MCTYRFNPFTGSLDDIGEKGNAFVAIQTPFGTSPVADSPEDVLTLTSTDGSVIITGNALTDSIDFSAAYPVNVDGGTAESVYTAQQVINGGSA